MHDYIDFTSHQIAISGHEHFGVWLNSRAGFYQLAARVLESDLIQIGRIIDGDRGTCVGIERRSPDPGKAGLTESICPLTGSRILHLGWAQCHFSSGATDGHLMHNHDCDAIFTFPNT